MQNLSQYTLANTKHIWKTGLVVNLSKSGLKKGELVNIGAVWKSHTLWPALPGGKLCRGSWGSRNRILRNWAPSRAGLGGWAAFSPWQCQTPLGKNVCCRLSRLRGRRAKLDCWSSSKHLTTQTTLSPSRPTTHVTAAQWVLGEEEVLETERWAFNGAATQKDSRPAWQAGRPCRGSWGSRSRRRRSWAPNRGGWDASAASWISQFQRPLDKPFANRPARLFGCLLQPLRQGTGNNRLSSSNKTPWTQRC